MLYYGIVIWDVNPIAIELGFLAIRWYSLLFGLGFILCYHILKKQFIKDGIPISLFDKLSTYIVLGAIFGARLGHVLFYDFDYYSKNILEIFLPIKINPDLTFVGFQGLASHGGAIGILICLFLFCKKENLSFLKIADKLVLVVPLAGCLIRLGNLFNSEIVGLPSSVPWAFVFSAIDNQSRHPAQLYESIYYALVFIVLSVLNKSLPKRKEGYNLGVFMILVFSFRFIIEFLKENQVTFEHSMFMNLGQLLSIPFIILGMALIANANLQRDLNF